MNKYIGFFAAAAAAFAVTSCTDTWNDHYDGVDGNSATQTLWEQIQANPNLSKFADIASKAYYYKDEKHPQANYTYKDMLSGTQLLTVWAPENSAISDADYEKWKKLCETNGYTVQQQLMGNSIALFRNIANGTADTTLTMLNGKKYKFLRSVPSMAGVKLNEKNIAATNGTLHTIGSTIPFQYNFYEYLKDAANTEVSTFHNYVIDTDTTYFSSSNSIEGNPDQNGNPTYVDSVYFTTNTMFMGTRRFPSESNTDQYLTYDESFGANINSEDSSFVMIFPNDKAWADAAEKLAPLYKYADIYVDNEKVNGGSSNVYRTVSNADSLQKKCINMDIVSPLCFNVNMQPNAAGRRGVWKADDFVNTLGSSAEYFVNTFGDTLRSGIDTITWQYWDKTSIFDGVSTPTKMSNGYAFVSDKWAMPRKLFMPDVKIEVGYQSFYNTNKAQGNWSSFGFSNSAHTWADSTGNVSYDNFYYISPASASGNPKFEFRLVGTDGENHESEVMSGKYDIYLVLVPNYYMTSNDSTIVMTTGTSGSGYINADGDTIPVMHKFTATLNYCNNNANGKDATITSKTFEYDGKTVQMVRIPFYDNDDPFEFPYSYKNLRQCYPTLTLTTKTTSSDRKAGYSNDFCIDRIILVSREEIE